MIDDKNTAWNKNKIEMSWEFGDGTCAPLIKHPKDYMYMNFLKF